MHSQWRFTQQIRIKFYSFQLARVWCCRVLSSRNIQYTFQFSSYEIMLEQGPQIILSHHSMSIWNWNLSTKTTTLTITKNSSSKHRASRCSEDWCLWGNSMYLIETSDIIHSLMFINHLTFSIFHFLLLLFWPSMTLLKCIIMVFQYRNVQKYSTFLIKQMKLDYRQISFSHKNLL